MKAKTSAKRETRGGEFFVCFFFSFFLLPSSRASHSFCTSRKMLRSPPLGHKAPVMQANESISQKVVNTRR